MYVPLITTSAQDQTTDSNNSRASPLDTTSNTDPGVKAVLHSKKYVHVLSTNTVARALALFWTVIFTPTPTLQSTLQSLPCSSPPNHPGLLFDFAERGSSTSSTHSFSGNQGSLWDSAAGSSFDDDEYESELETESDSGQQSRPGVAPSVNKSARELDSKYGKSNSRGPSSSCLVLYNTSCRNKGKQADTDTPQSHISVALLLGLDGRDSTPSAGNKTDGNKALAQLSPMYDGLGVSRNSRSYVNTKGTKGRRGKVPPL
ncbi:hypothetical protein T439DRAFT_337807 [Meredithblackwellia eburnea MCA 4105]